ncbi:hypothetical protein [Methylibium sp.]|uniref:hypothetical protein n=1 Tax=Methylibium sp. TaxID=2067992 RepID=UPI0017A670D4|nr:hypothetical protein [Methylibium sp.]MBA3588200.1 hypothetical protein [Methylibium sp.]
MKQPYVVALIEKDAVEHLPVCVLAHEIPVLAMVHGEGKVSIDENADLPQGVIDAEFEVEDEFARLEQRYGVHPDTRMSYATMAFNGVDGFARALEGPRAVEGGRRKKA